MAGSAPRERLLRALALIGAGLLSGYHVSAQAPLPVSRIQLAVSAASDTLTLGRASRIMIRAQVTDAQGRPLRRAIVMFVILPSASGAGAVFATGGLSATVATDDHGIAQAVIERPSGGAGEFKVEVKASYEGAIAQPAQITLKNVRPPGIGIGKLAAIGGLGGGVVAAAVLLAGRVETKNDGNGPVRTRIVEGQGRLR